MPVKRHFIGWDAPLTTKVREFLLPEKSSGPVNLGKDLIIVPTRQASRRLRETLAQHCSEEKAALLSPQVETPVYFFRPDSETINVATPTEVVAIWANLLRQADLNQFKGLFPARAPEQDFAWAMYTGDEIEGLRDTLADGGYRIADVFRDFSDILEEFDRWQDLSQLETAYLKQLEEFGLQDPCELMIKRAANPKLPKGNKRIVIAAVPDPTPLMVRALENLAEYKLIIILIHAPESMSDHFDKWGRPITEKWQQSRIDIPNPNMNVILAGSPASQSRNAVGVIAAEQDRFGPADIAIGVPDGSVTPFLEADLDDKGLTPFDPSGKAIKEHPIYLLLDTYRTLLNEGSYAALGAFLRNADILDFLQNEFSMLPLQLLEEFDEFQNRHLPMGWEDIGDRLAQSQERDQFGHIEKATGFVKEQIDNFQNKDLDSTVRLLLQTVYQFRMVNPQNPDDKEFIAVAQAIDNSLQELASESINNLEIEKAHAFDLLLRRLAGQRCYVEYEETEIDLEGWLELSWNNAPILIVTCMNDGQVPESHLDDIFLPDSLRTLLNLRHDSDRLATDAFLMRTLIESRNTTGRACFIAGKTSSTGDPLKPSRLLFHCSDEELPERAKRLFGDPQEKLDNHPATIGFPLQVTPPADIMPEYLEIRKLPVTAFKDYLACPFRFYLKHVLGMEGLDDQKTEMDSLDFGALIHEVLQEMAENSEISKSENEQEISQFLHAQAKRWVKERFGETPPLPVQIQLDSAKQRLSAAARVQTQLVREGWQIKRYEMKVSTQLNGMDISGRIDRIDQHRETGRLRILDYKTSDRATMPQAAHMGSASPDAPDYVKFFINGKEKSWIDLQLPLYRILLPEEEFGSQIELGYFNLPKAIGDTGITIWEEMGIDHLDSARHCAENVIEGIRNLRFWPPAARVKYDDFENLFPAEISDCIDEQPFEAFMKRPK